MIKLQTFDLYPQPLSLTMTNYLIIVNITANLFLDHSLHHEVTLAMRSNTPNLDLLPPYVTLRPGSSHDTLSHGEQYYKVLFGMKKFQPTKQVYHA